MSSYVFGPVPSRRLGRSLGVDLVPFKTCSFDCIYCQLGRTTCKTTQRKEWVPLNDVVAGLQEKVATDPDYVTLSGSGEPTLHIQFGRIIEIIKETFDKPVAVLTNGSLLNLPDVRAGLMRADLVIPSLDAGDAAMFRYVNRPHESIGFDDLVEGLQRFRDAYSGNLWLEVFLMAGVTTVSAEVQKIVKLVDRIRPDRVQLNTVTRPPAEKFAFPAAQWQMERIATMFRNNAEVIADHRAVHRQADFAVRRGAILDMLLRRPCTLQDIANGLGSHPSEVTKHMDELTREGLVDCEQREGLIYYKRVYSCSTARD